MRFRVQGVRLFSLLWPRVSVYFWCFCYPVSQILFWGVAGSGSSCFLTFLVEWFRVVVYRVCNIGFNQLSTSAPLP